MTQDSFIGIWRLISLELRSMDEQVSHPFGKNPIGYIIYTEDGYMYVSFMSANRPKFASSNSIRGGTTEEKVAAADTYLSYCGKYEVQDNRVIHHIEVSFFPNWSGVDQVRFFKFDGNRLSLSTPPLLLAGKQQTAHLIWERV